MGGVENRGRRPRFSTPPKGPGECCRFDPLPGQNILSWRFDHEIFFRVILSLPLIQEGQLSVSGEGKCTILVKCSDDLVCTVKVWLGQLTALNMTPLGWPDRKTSTQTNSIREKCIFFLCWKANKTCIVKQTGAYSEGVSWTQAKPL